MPVTMLSTWQRPLLKPSSLVFGSQTCIAFAPDGSASQGRCCGSRVCTRGVAHAVMGVRMREREARAMNMCFAHDA
eukprot:5840767-Prymnesium_polylepis.1